MSDGPYVPPRRTMVKRQRKAGGHHWTRRKRHAITMTTPPLLSFGLISDVQYADVEDGWNYARTYRRYYRHALVLLREAIDEWVRRAEGGGAHSVPKKPIKFAVNLGDLIDGKNKPAGTSQAALEDTRELCRVFEERIGGPVHHIVGNHELYNMTQREFEERLKWPPAPKAYYDFTMPDYAAKTRFIVLNAYGISSLGRHASDPIFQEARAWLRRVNTNDDLNSPLGLKRFQKRMVEYNGAIDNEQLEWLRLTLSRSVEDREDVLIFSHIPIHPKSCPWNCLLWNYEEVLQVILDHAACVRVVFSGHVHLDGYAKDKGVHFVVSDAVLECNPDLGETAHAIVDVHEDRVVINGYGKVPTRELMFSKAR